MLVDSQRIHEMKGSQYMSIEPPVPSRFHAKGMPPCFILACTSADRSDDNNSMTPNDLSFGNKSLGRPLRPEHGLRRSSTEQCDGDCLECGSGDDQEHGDSSCSGGTSGSSSSRFDVESLAAERSLVRSAVRYSVGDGCYAATPTSCERLLTPESR